MFGLGWGGKKIAAVRARTVYTAGQEKTLPKRRFVASSGDFSDIVAAPSA